jgi:glucose-6-phosphate isomerase
MSTEHTSLWERYQKYLCVTPEVGVSVDVSRVRFPDDYLATMSPAIASAMDAMEALEAGAIANSGENRMAGHFWLRAPELAPTSELARAIKAAITEVRAFTDLVHQEKLRSGNERFKHLVHIGIGGSALGPQFLCEALRTNQDPFTVDFLDNSDPDAITVLFARLEGELDQTLVSVVSKCGYTPTPKYVQLEVERIFTRHGLDFARHALATTVDGSDVDHRSTAEHWLGKFRMWDWVGGRMSVTSAVGLLPAALQGVDIVAFLRGAAAMDRATRTRDTIANPAAMLALMWHWLGQGRGEKNMVVLPYRDRLQLLPRYVQQLVMESIGKKHNRDGEVVEQGLTVYGNKGSTDQHAYLQQLRAGTNDFFVVFVRAQKDRADATTEIEPGVTLGDYLFGSSEGSRDALYERGRDSITITLPDVSAESLGALIALFERAVGIYAELINVNAYDQPGVDKFVADPTAHLQQAVIAHLHHIEAPQTAEEIGYEIGQPDKVENIYRLLQRLAGDPARGLKCAPGQTVFNEQFSLTHRPMQNALEVTR